MISDFFYFDDFTLLMKFVEHQSENTLEVGRSLPTTRQSWGKCVTFSHINAPKKTSKAAILTLIHFTFWCSIVLMHNFVN